MDYEHMTSPSDLANLVQDTAYRGFFVERGDENECSSGGRTV